MKFTPAVFHNRTKAVDLNATATTLEAAAAYITNSLSYAEAAAAGSTISWSNVHKLLMDYADEARKLASLAQGQIAVNNASSTYVRGKVNTVIIPDGVEINIKGTTPSSVVHSMRHGMSLCGLGKPMDWPEGHYQAAAGETITCKGCITEAMKGLTGIK